MPVSWGRRERPAHCSIRPNIQGLPDQFGELAGVEGPLDWNIVRAILCGRQDAEILSGGSHYRLIETKP